MVVKAINPINFNSNNLVNFNGKNKNKRTDSSEYPSKHAGQMVTVPAALLFALMTASSTPNQVRANNLGEPNSIEMTATPPQAPQNDKQWYPGLGNISIRNIIPLEINGEAYQILYTYSGTNNTNEVNRLYFAPKNFKGLDKYNHTIQPPHISSIVYHDLGKDKEFCGIKVSEYIQDARGNRTHIKVKEYRLTDEVAQQIIDFCTDDTKWKNKTVIKFEETQSPKLAETKFYEYK